MLICNSLHIKLMTGTVAALTLTAELNVKNYSMASQRQRRIRVEFEVGVLEIIPVVMAGPPAGGLEFGGGVGKARQRSAKPLEMRRSQGQSRERRKSAGDAFRTDSSLLTLNRCGRFIRSRARVDQPTQEADLLPA